LNELELETLVVRLTGDGSSYQRMLQQAQTQAQTSATAIEGASKRIESFAGGMQSFAAGALTALSALGASQFLRNAFNLFKEQETGMMRLSTAIQATGRNAKAVIADYEAFASGIERATLTTKGHTLALVAQAELRGITGEAAKKAVENAIALAKATGQDVDSMMHMSIAMAEGNTHMIQRALHLHNIRDPQLLQVKINEMLAKGMAIATAETQTSAGALQRLGHDVERITKQFGGLVAQGVRPVIEAYTWLAEKFQGLDVQTKTIIITVAALVAGILLLPYVASTAALVLSTVFSPVVLVVAAVGIAVGALINKAGGVAEAWRAVRAAGEAAWEWIGPVREEVMELFGTIWTTGKEVWIELRDFVTAAWDTMIGGATVSWSSIRDTVRDAIIAMEFSIKNWRLTVQLVWTNIKLAATIALEFCRDAVVFFVATATGAMAALKEFFVAAWKNIRGVVTGESVNMADAMQREFRRAHDGVIEMMGGGDLSNSQRIRGELRELTTEYNQAFNEFRNRRLGIAESTMLTGRDADAHVRAYRDFGSRAGISMTQAFKHEAGKMDAALFGSAEAMSRLAAQKDKFVSLTGTVGGVAGAAVAGAAAAAPAVTVASVASSVPSDGQVRELLRRIAIATEKSADKKDTNPLDGVTVSQGTF